MRDAAADQVSDLQGRLSPHLHEGVLVVERDNRSLGAKGTRRLRACRLDVSRHRKLHVVRDVALAEAKQYQAGFYGLSTAGNVVLFILVTVVIVPLFVFLNRREVNR